MAQKGKIRLAINGFGRIGRHVCRLALQNKNFEVVAINDLVPADNLAYLFKYDTVHHRHKGSVSFENHNLVVDNHKIAVTAVKDPVELPWKQLGVDFVIESTGRFTQKEDAEKHLKAGAKKVIISAPPKGEVPTFVMGVNQQKYLPQEHHVVSNASCTTNCLAPLAKILHDEFGIEEGLMTTVHALTATQAIVDAPSARDFRGGRAAAHNIVPASTGAAKAVTLCIPELKGKLTGMSFRVPVIDVSVVDLTVRLRKGTSYEKLCAVMQAAAQGKWKGIVDYTEEEVVSSDFIGDRHSCIFDAKAGIALSEHFFKLIAWYDNEFAYCCRLLDLAEYMHTKN